MWHFFVRDSVSLILKDFFSHMFDLEVYMRTEFQLRRASRRISRKLWEFLYMFLTGLLHSVSYFCSLYRWPFLSLCKFLMLFHLTLIKFSRSDYLLMNLPLVTLTSIIRTRYSILVELIVLKSSVTILIRGLAFLLRSLSKTLVTLGPTLLNLFFSDASICFTAFLSLGN